MPCPPFFFFSRRAKDRHRVIPPLAVRNLTPRSLELVSVEAFAAERHGDPTGSALSSRTLGLALEPFATRQTDVSAPRHGSEVLALTFAVTDTTTTTAAVTAAPNDGGNGGRYRYEAIVPSPKGAASGAFIAMTAANGGPDRLAVVYLPTRALVAVVTAPRLHAWMRELNDDWPLTMLSVPGTHNSLTCHRALPSVRCQAVPVPRQLAHGVRFLDVRVSVSPLASDPLTLVHSAFPVALTGRKYLSNLLSDVYAFLDHNPSETVIMSLKREGTGKGSDAHLATRLEHAHVDKMRHRWWTEPCIPTLGQARGKIVLLRRFGLDSGRRWAIDAAQWPDNCEDGTGGDGGCVRIQDFYDVAHTRAIDDKINYSHSQLERAAEQHYCLPGTPGSCSDAPVPPFFVNFLTASNFFNASCWPERVAARVNPAVVDYLCTVHGEAGKGPRKLNVGCAGTGIVVTDWVGANDDWDLTRCIVAMNAMLQQRPQDS